MTATDLRSKSRSSITRGSDDHKRIKEKRSEYDSGTIWFMFYSTATIVTCIKFLLIPSYYSTDLEVHRNWMAITYNKPLSEWYSESTSKWTLDYPPFFAYFEYILAYLAKFFDKNMLQIQQDPYMSPETLFYMRLTVIISDLVYYYGVYQWIRLMYKRKPHIFTSLPAMCTRSNFFQSSTSFSHIVLFIFNIGHLIVDHVHFQYNGFLNGMLLISMANICNQKIYWGSFWFAVLLNFKHIYLYMAPAYFIYLFIEHCLIRDSRGSITMKIRLNILLRLIAIVIGVFVVSFLPFIINGQFYNLINRLFPFQRGLTHSYWAPNFWALYNGYDLLMARFYRTTDRQSPYTGGLVQQSEHLILPTITPAITLAIIVVIIITISATYIHQQQNNNRTKTTTSRNQNQNQNSVAYAPEIRFLHLILLSSLTFFEFGYHVHEKSILLVIPSLIPLIFVNIDYAQIFLLISIAGYYSLFPLLYKEAEAMLKVLLMAIHLLLSFGTLNSRYRIVKRWVIEKITTYVDSDDDYGTEHEVMREIKDEFRENPPFSFLKLPLLNVLESIYILGFIFIHSVYTFGPYIFPDAFERLQFLPLLLISIYCSVGILYCYNWLFTMFFFTS
ncbi:dolichyl pyrophosphate glc1man9glcnac2 [Dermatophagoides farinae]|uniref:Alpha-1,3-glucosyltransferase n=1 Tax=Dermatophagoides farinae TaxID=6954 RepID=A0A9D4NQZ4_DERFA|nr:probable dolichyl pyrophosphate Glc1Man9GlcNAc2 alpha-1,3-glucosyltransferase [Dermatophagoides farinae]KAH7637168.1 dolichyl pyrophosphate glc1man9glcnac2 [Dermatophagoides farinae]